MAEKSQCGANTYPAGTDWHGNSHTTHEMNQRCYLVTWDTSSNSADVFLSVRWYPFFSGLVRAHVTSPLFDSKFWQLWTRVAFVSALSLGSENANIAPVSPGVCLLSAQMRPPCSLRMACA